MSALIAVRRIAAPEYTGQHADFARLATRARDANPHMAPAAVAAALTRIAPGEIVVLAAWLSEALGAERLAGIWVLRRRRDARCGFAPALAAPLLPLYEVSSAPVLDPDHADDAARALLRHILASPDLPKTLLLPLCPRDGQTARILDEAFRLTGSRAFAFERWVRPMLLPQAGDDAATYLRRALGSSFKKRMQQFRALGRAGAVGFRRARGAAGVQALDAFLSLEAAGWKGVAGTALVSEPDDEAYIRTLAAAFAATDGLVIDALLLEGAPIAMGLLIEAGRTRHFLKIAYDETQSRLSPGRALTIAMLQADLAGTPPAVFDSGAGEEVDAGTYVWGERREMANVVVSLGSAKSGPAVLAARARMLLRRLRARWRAHRSAG